MARSTTEILLKMLEIVKAATRAKVTSCAERFQCSFEWLTGTLEFESMLGHFLLVSVLQRLRELPSSCDVIDTWIAKASGRAAARFAIAESNLAVGLRQSRKRRKCKWLSV